MLALQSRSEILHALVLRAGGPQLLGEALLLRLLAPLLPASQLRHLLQDRHELRLAAHEGPATMLRSQGRRPHEATAAALSRAGPRRGAVHGGEGARLGAEAGAQGAGGECPRTSHPRRQGHLNLLQRGVGAPVHPAPITTRGRGVVHVDPVLRHHVRNGPHDPATGTGPTRRQTQLRRVSYRCRRRSLPGFPPCSRQVRDAHGAISPQQLDAMAGAAMATTAVAPLVVAAVCVAAMPSVAVVASRCERRLLQCCRRPNILRPTRGRCTRPWPRTGAHRLRGCGGAHASCAAPGERASVHAAAKAASTSLGAGAKRQSTTEAAAGAGARGGAAVRRGAGDRRAILHRTLCSRASWTTRGRRYATDAAAAQPRGASHAPRQPSRALALGTICGCNRRGIPGAVFASGGGSFAFAGCDGRWCLLCGCHRRAAGNRRRYLSAAGREDRRARRTD
mmetsp:Transcript_115256/g.366404  ORF Transcript_115256/g.366404 Transcript_115256/m.366404 type:complete len:451 (-) Transcript_115256:768-2120(-)